MSFDIAQTPTLQAVATLDQHRLVEDLQQRVEDAVRQAEEQPEVIAAAEAQRHAEHSLGQLKKAERALNQYAKETGQKLAALRDSALDAIIQSAANGDKLDFRALSELATLENRSRQASRAIERLVERLIPLAHLVRLREESHAAMTRARALEQIAQERAEKLLGQLRDAVSEEVVLPVDMSKGVSGALLAQASELKRRAIQLSENADTIEKTVRR
jgi:hypothetical protein